LLAGQTDRDFALPAFDIFKYLDRDEENIFLKPVESGAVYVTGAAKGHL